MSARAYGIEVFVHDPAADAIVAAVAHRNFLELGVEDFTRKLIKGGVFIDVKAMFDAAQLKAAGIGIWRL